MGLGIVNASRPGNRDSVYDLVAMLKIYKATATFFIRHSVLTTPLTQVLIGLIKENGHEVGIHCEPCSATDLRQRVCEALHLLNRKHGMQVRYARFPEANTEQISELEFLGLVVVCGRGRCGFPKSGDICMVDNAVLEDALKLDHNTCNYTTIQALLETIWT